MKTTRADSNFDGEAGRSRATYVVRACNCHAFVVSLKVTCAQSKRDNVLLPYGIQRFAIPLKIEVGSGAIWKALVVDAADGGWWTASKPEPEPDVERTEEIVDSMERLMGSWINRLHVGHKCVQEDRSSNSRRSPFTQIDDSRVDMLWLRSTQPQINKAITRSEQSQRNEQRKQLHEHESRNLRPKQHQDRIQVLSVQESVSILRSLYVVTSFLVVNDHLSHSKSSLRKKGGISSFVFASSSYSHQETESSGPKIKVKRVFVCSISTNASLKRHPKTYTSQKARVQIQTSLASSTAFSHHRDSIRAEQRLARQARHSSTVTVILYRVFSSNMYQYRGSCCFFAASFPVLYAVL